MSRGKLCAIQLLPEMDTGGVEETTLEFSSWLAGRGHRSIVVSGGGRLVPRLEAAGVRHASLPVGEKGPRLLSAFAPLRKLMIESGADILHLRSRVPAWLGMAVAKSLPERLRPRVVTTFHGTYSVHYFSGIMARGERVTAESRFIFRHAADNYGIRPPKLRLIPAGYDERRFFPGAVEKERLSALASAWGLSENSGPVILLPARITPWKGHRFFIAALARIRHLPFTAFCVGDPAENPVYAEELLAMVKEKGLSGRVIFPGRCADMPAAYALCRVAVSASLEPESFGRVAIEAQALGRPVVATAHGGSLDTVKDGVTGFLVPKGDEAALAAALEKILTDDDLGTRMGEAASRFVAANFSSESMCERILDLYYEVLAVR